MPKRRCLDCSALTNGTTRCPRCTRTHQAPKRAASNARYDAAWKRHSRDTRAAWIAEHGWTCPGWDGDPPHPSTDLVVDHDVGVLCRYHNSAKAGGWDKRNDHR